MSAPYGHDQPVYGTPWATRGLVCLLALVFAGQWLWDGGDRGAQAELSAAIDRVVELRSAHPEARVDRSLLGRAPVSARRSLGAIGRADGQAVGAHDVELETAVESMIEASSRLSVRLMGYRSGEPSLLSAITAGFVHAGPWHLLSNVLFLLAVGPVIECFWDRPAYLIGYALFGLAATGAHHLANPDSLVPLVGASGAISGLLGAFVVGFPRTRVRLPGIDVPAVAVALLWAGMQLAFALAGFEQGVAHEAHLGGLCAGVVAALGMRLSGRQIGDAGDGREQ